MVGYKAGGLIGGIVGISIAIMIAAAIMPTALRTQANVNQTYYAETWGTGVSTMYFTLVPIIAVVALLFIFLGYSVKRKYT